VADEDGLHGIDSVHADHLGICHDRQLTAGGRRGLAEASPKPSRHSRVGRTQDDENALAALQSADSRSARAAAAAGDDEIDGSDHCVRLAGAGSLTTIVDFWIRWVSLIAVSEYQRGADRRDVIRSVASASGSEIERLGQRS